MKYYASLDKWAAKAKVDMKTLTKLVAFRAHDRIVERTPVDTGRCRASWTIIAGPAADLSTEPDTFSGGAAAASGRAAQRKAAVEASYQYVIANNLPYARPLEYGHSKQAPNGMMRLAIADTLVWLETGGK